VTILSDSVTHEIRNYLTSISINIRSQLSEKELGRIKERIRALSYVIDNFQQQIRGTVNNKLSKEDFERCSITKDIEETLKLYRFKVGEKQLITVESSKDFEYIGDSGLTEHMLSTLIKNALLAIAKADKGRITIKLKPGVKYNELCFKDTGTGIAKELLPKMFKLFESSSIADSVVGMGLSFCKLIMQSYNGDIICDSAKGEYTEFILIFPCIEGA
jgi:signal transduction histidine kinase